MQQQKYTIIWTYITYEMIESLSRKSSNARDQMRDGYRVDQLVHRASS